MSSEWHQVSLKEVTSVLGDGLHGTPAYDPNGDHFFINGNNLNNGKIAFNANTKRVSAIEAAKHKKNLTDRTILVSINGTLGNVAFYAGEKVVLGKSACYFNVKAGVDKQFIRYVIDSEIFQGYIQNLATGSTIKNVSLKLMRDFQFSLPPIDLQQRISATLSCLDDRITLLRETNTTLEAIAQALFKSWFVDFDPVCAKMEGRAPEGMDEATAALFPNGFEESELGLVPEGWQPLSVSEVAEIVKGKSYSSKDLVDKHETALVTLKSFARGGGFRLDGFKPYSGTYKASQIVQSGDLIVAYTDVTQAAELIGKPAIVIGVDEYKTLVASLDVGIIRPLTAKVSRQFLYGLFNTDAFQAHTLSHTSGTTVLHLSKDGVGSYRFACSPISVVEAFSTIAESLTSRQQVNIDQMRNLAILRDTLLPRLISGQLRLPEAEALPEEAFALSPPAVPRSLCPKATPTG